MGFRMNDDLMKRLTMAGCNRAVLIGIPLEHEARDRIEAQAAEIARLRGELASIRGACDSTKGEHVVMTKGRYRFCIHCGETMTAAKIKAADDFVRARAAIRANEDRP